jgi:multiple sugar transport system substrate-binding protein
VRIRSTEGRHPGLFATLLLAVSLAASACSASDNDTKGSTAATTGERVEVRMAHFVTDESANKIDDVLAAYNASQDRYLAVAEPAGDALEDRVRASIRNGNPPDLVYLSSTQSLAAFASSGGATPLQPFVDRDEFDLDQIVPSALESAIVDGQLVGLPMGIDSYALYINRAAFVAAGLDPDSPPTTFDELLDVAEQLTTTDASGRIEQLGFEPTTGSDLEVWASTAGVGWFDEDQQPAAADDPAWAAVFSFLEEYYKRFDGEAVRERLASFGDFYSAQAPFLTGELAMTVIGEWYVATIEELAPDLDYSVYPVPVPAGSPERYGAGHVGGSSLFIPAGAANADGAWDLMKWLAVDDAAQRGFIVDVFANIPTGASVLAEVSSTATPPLKTFFEIAEHPLSASMPSTPLGWGLLEPFNRIAEEIRFGRGDWRDQLRTVDDEIATALAAAS